MSKAISRSIIPLLVLFFIGIAVPDAQAQIGARRRGGAKGGAILRVKSKRVVRRTAIVLIAAHNSLKQGKVYTGNFAKAVRHQRYARFLWRRGFYLRAIHQSRVARLLALSVIKANKGTTQASYDFDKEENSLMKNAPSESQMETEMNGDKDYQQAYPNQSTKDEDFLGEVGDIDLEDLD